MPPWRIRIGDGQAYRKMKHATLDLRSQFNNRGLTPNLCRPGVHVCKIQGLNIPLRFSRHWENILAVLHAFETTDFLFLLKQTELS